MENISFENATMSFYTISVSFTKIFGYGLPRTLLLSGFCSTLLQWCIININSILVSNKYTVHLYLTKTDSLYIKRKMLTQCSLLFSLRYSGSHMARTLHKF